MVTVNQLRYSARRIRREHPTPAARLDEAATFVDTATALLDDALQLLLRMESNGAIRTPFPGHPEIVERLQRMVGP